MTKDIKKEKVAVFKELLNEIKKVGKNGCTIQSYFDKIASFLFRNLQIRAGNDNYTFAEIEFYYHSDELNLNNSIYNCTYPRIRNSGDFFWHYSGVDICFDSNYNMDGNGNFGGILIRSLTKHGSEGGIIAGPMRCTCELMNSCNSENTAPYLADLEEDIRPKEDLYSTIRYGVNDENQLGDKELHFCYYLDPISWTRKRNNVLMMKDNKTRYEFCIEKNDTYSAIPSKRGKHEKVIEVDY